MSESQFANGHRNGNFSFAIPRAWHSYGAADTEAPDNVRNARAAGYARVDVYAFVCPGGGGASSQIDGLVKFIRDNRMEIDTVWLDVEGPQYWTGSVSGNQQYMTELVDSMRSSGMRFGVYSSPGEWSDLFGSWSLDIPACWYADYDGSLSCQSEPFPGCHPSFKQFNDHDSFCADAGFSCDISVKC